MATLGATSISFLSSPCLSSNSKTTSSSLSPTLLVVSIGKSISYRGCVACSAVQESSSPTTTGVETKATTPQAEAKPSAPKAARPKPVAAKPLPELMLEDVIPSLKTILEVQDALSQIELTFQDNKLEGSFVKEGCPYSLWAFFPDGVLTGPRNVVFWVEKRLASQGIIPVWNQ